MKATIATVACCITTLAGTSLAAQGAEGVSPGHPSNVTVVESRCPTFSFGGPGGARSYELAVYDLDEGDTDDEESRPVLREAFPGWATSFTPALEDCLERGRRYAWSVRAVGPEDAGEWSTPRLFEVADAPGEAELAAAIELVERYAASRGEAAPAPELASGEDPGGQGPDGVGSGGVERLPAPASAAGAALSVDGGVAAGFFAGDGSALVNLPPASDVACSSCISGFEVASGSLTGSDIATGSLTGSDIANGSVTGSDIANGTLSGTDIGNGSIGQFDLKTIYSFAVECDGSCWDVTLGQVCDTGTTATRYPIAVSCGNVQEHSSGSTCGSGNTCYRPGRVGITERGDALGEFCDDGSGVDALVFCMFP